MELRNLSRCPRQACRNLRQRVRLSMEPPTAFPDQRGHDPRSRPADRPGYMPRHCRRHGDWKLAHEDQVLAMVKPDRLDRAKDYAVEHGCDIFDALDEVRRNEKRWKYRRRSPRRSALPPRRLGEERNTRRYFHPPRLAPEDIERGYLRHVPVGSAITSA